MIQKIYQNHNVCYISCSFFYGLHYQRRIIPPLNLHTILIEVGNFVVQMLCPVLTLMQAASIL